MELGAGRWIASHQAIASAGLSQSNVTQSMLVPLCARVSRQWVTAEQHGPVASVGIFQPSHPFKQQC